MNSCTLKLLGVEKHSGKRQCVFTFTVNMEELRSPGIKFSSGWISLHQLLSFLRSSLLHLMHFRLSSVSVKGCEGQPVQLYNSGREEFVSGFVFQSIYSHFSTASVSHLCPATSYLISQAHHSAVVADGSCEQGNSLISAPSTSSVW